ncbi:MAG: tRNA 4-thiouridine(8) synthase ThiI [Chlorobi bacterium]|nr:tRNA 4-thiouridine(8) synthase ThiI [Chlorobiota bacterium]
MKEMIVVNFEEIFLKGDNRRFFVRQLKKNLKEKLADFGRLLEIERVRGGSIFIRVREPLDASAWEKIKERLRFTPGITQFYLVRSVAPEPEIITEAAVDYARGKIEDKPDFRVTVKRVDKHKPFTSRELAARVGAALVETYGTKVNLENPSWTLHVKVRPEQAFIYADVVQGVGGLPVGSSGKAYVLLSGGIDSPVAAYKAAVRGLALTALHFHSVPKTSPRSIDKVKDLARTLARIHGPMDVYFIPVLEIQQAIAERTDSKLRLILLRRFFLKIAERLGEDEGIRAVVTGDSLGQVASQTLENMHAIQAVTDRLVLRPLLAEDKKSVIRTAREIGTYDISIRPHDDACALFTPKRPETRANLSYVESQWARLDADSLINRALEKIERFRALPS